MGREASSACRRVRGRRHRRGQQDGRVRRCCSPASGDHVVLEARTRPGLPGLAAGLGLRAAEVHVAARPGTAAATSAQDALADAALLGTLAGLADRGAALLPARCVRSGGRAGRRTGAPAGHATAPHLQGRQQQGLQPGLADELGLRQPAGWACETPEQLGAAVPEAATAARRTAGRSCVKDAFGVSGKGIVVVADANAWTACTGWSTVRPAARAPNGSAWWWRVGGQARRPELPVHRRPRRRGAASTSSRRRSPSTASTRDTGCRPGWTTRSWP